MRNFVSLFRSFDDLMEVICLKLGKKFYKKNLEHVFGGRLRKELMALFSAHVDENLSHQFRLKATWHVSG